MPCFLHGINSIHQTMDIGHKRLLVAAQGYSELGLPDLAIGELDLLPEEIQRSPVGVESRLSVLMQAKRWKSALGLGRELCRLVPDKSVGFIHAAFCLHELGQSQAALDLLVNGPPSLRSEPTYHYNLACYEAALGNLDQARAHLQVSFAMDKKLKDYARTDPDLQALRTAGN